MVIPYVLALYKHVTEPDYPNLSSIANRLRDSLLARFQGVFWRCHMANVIGESQVVPYSNRVFLTACVLDPNNSILWIKSEVACDEASKLLLQTEIRGIADAGYVCLYYIGIIVI